MFLIRPLPLFATKKHIIKYENVYQMLHYNKRKFFPAADHYRHDKFQLDQCRAPRRWPPKTENKIISIQKM